VTKYPTNLERGAALPCETLMLEKQQQTETCIVIYDTSQGNIGTRFRSGETLLWLFIYYKFTDEFALKEVWKSVNKWRSYG